MNINKLITDIYNEEGNKRFLRSKSKIHNYATEIYQHTKLMPESSSLKERVEVIRKEYLPLYDPNSDIRHVFQTIFVNTSGKINSPMFKSKHATEFIKRFLLETQHIETDSISQRWYHLKNDIRVIPTCPTCEAKLPWTDQGYKQYCSQNCWTQSETISDNTHKQFKGRSFKEQGRTVSPNLNTYGIHGKYKNIHFRSADELLVMMFYTSNGYTIETAENRNFSVQYYDLECNQERTYYPDLYIPELATVIEVKPVYQLQDQIVIDKFNALKSKLVNFSCKIISINDIQEFVDTIDITDVDKLISEKVLEISNEQYKRLRRKNELKTKKSI